VFIIYIIQAEMQPKSSKTTTVTFTAKRTEKHSKASPKQGGEGQSRTGQKDSGRKK